jgi:hypothetical protein
LALPPAAFAFKFPANEFSSFIIIIKQNLSKDISFVFAFMWFILLHIGVRGAQLFGEFFFKRLGKIPRIPFLLPFAEMIAKMGSKFPEVCKGKY